MAFHLRLRPVPFLSVTFSFSSSFPFIAPRLSLWQPSELHCYNREAKFPMWNGQSGPGAGGEGEGEGRRMDRRARRVGAREFQWRDLEGMVSEDKILFSGHFLKLAKMF